MSSGDTRVGWNVVANIELHFWSLFSRLSFQAEKETADRERQRERERERSNRPSSRPLIALLIDGC